MMCIITRTLLYVLTFYGIDDFSNAQNAEVFLERFGKWGDTIEKITYTCLFY